jgi:hypothetical protein
MMSDLLPVDWRLLEPGEWSREHPEMWVPTGRAVQTLGPGDIVKLAFRIPDPEDLVPGHIEFLWASVNYAVTGGYIGCLLTQPNSRTSLAPGRRLRFGPGQILDYRRRGEEYTANELSQAGAGAESERAGAGSSCQKPRSPHRRCLAVYVAVSVVIAGASLVVWALFFIFGGFLVYASDYKPSGLLDFSLWYKYLPTGAFATIVLAPILFRVRLPGSPHLWGLLYLMLTALPTGMLLVSILLSL